MQIEDKSKLEERVIAYFDGSLDGEGSRSLLREVAESPEKRALFKAHESLSRLIVAARVPMEAPLEVRRTIAERIPGMLAFIPGLLGTVETAPVLTQNANPFIAFFARMSLTTAVSIGSAVALLTAGILLKDNFEGHSTIPMQRVAAVQSSDMKNSAPQLVLPAHPLDRIKGSNRTGRLPLAFDAFHEAMPSRSQNNQKGTSNEEGSSNVASMIQPPAVLPVSLELANIPTQSAQSLLPLPLVAEEGITIRPYATTGERFVTINGINAPNTVQPVPSYLFGVEFDLGDRYAFRVQGGSSSFATLTTGQTSERIASIPVYQARVVAQSAAWSTVGISYSFPIVKFLPLIVSADGGAVFLSKTGVMGILGVATEISLFRQFLLRPSVTYDAVWTSLPGVASSDGSGIYANPVSQSSMLSTAMGFNISLMFRP